MTRQKNRYVSGKPLISRVCVYVYHMAKSFAVCYALEETFLYRISGLSRMVVRGTLFLRPDEQIKNVG